MRITPVVIKNEQKARELMSSLGVSRQGVRILSPKSVYSVFKIEGIKSWEANILKQHLLSQGSDAAIERDALVKDIRTGALIFGSFSQLKNLCKKLKNQPFNLKEISQTLSFYLDNIHKETYIFRANNKQLKINKPLVCGIINMTPDSFFQDGLLNKDQKYILERVEKMLKAGAKMIDIGGESTRPFSKPITEKEELARVIPTLKAIRKRFRKVLISLDSYKYLVVKAAAAEGVDLINDITALNGDLRKSSVIKNYKLGCVLMHMKGKPRDMQKNPHYKDVISEELDFFKERLQFCQRIGIDKERIMIDPGIGFGKDLNDNLKLINQLYKFKVFGLPLFLGLSRKSFIGKILKSEPGERLVGTLSATILSVGQGANILRTHDVAETVQALKVASKITNN
ncbi:MAG: dihydropteroate synthase [Candidatus Omnitrophica bacterium]|nr:dihydropteroate synthase [Candidatus Omnitrophota bacterium]